MNSQLLKKLSRQLLKKQDLYSWLQLYSFQVWNKIGFVRSRKGLRINETTITQNLVFDFWQLAAVTNLPVELYESKNEKANGNDLEIAVETSKGFLLFPCQVKIIQNNNRYGTLHHKNKSHFAFQMDMLINYASRQKGIPIYLFYNHYNNYERCCQIEEEIGFSPAYFGCSIVLAHYLNEYFPAPMKKGGTKGKTPSFEDLHPYTAWAFQDFVKDVQGIAIENLFPEKYITDKPLYYSREDINSDKYWNDLAPLPSIGFVIDIDKERAFVNSLNKQSAPFNPRFRIVLARNSRNGSLAIQS